MELPTSDVDTPDDGVTALSECIEHYLKNTSIVTIPYANTAHPPSSTVDEAISVPSLLSSLPPPSPLADSASETATSWVVLPPPSPFRDITPSPLSPTINEITTEHTSQSVDGHCNVCSGRPTTSGDVCRCATNSACRCRNCGLQSQQEICTRCLALAKCKSCHRHLPQDLFDDDDDEDEELRCRLQSLPQPKIEDARQISSQRHDVRSSVER